MKKNATLCSALFAVTVMFQVQADLVTQPDRLVRCSNEPAPSGYLPVYKRMNYPACGDNYLEVTYRTIQPSMVVCSSVRELSKILPDDYIVTSREGSGYAGCFQTIGAAVPSAYYYRVKIAKNGDKAC